MEECERPAQEGHHGGREAIPEGTMKQRTSWRAWAMAVMLLGGAPGLSYAQLPTGSAGMTANPYANLYLNPFLPSYMGQSSSITSNNTLLYMMMAQQMGGGIGSGQLSGVRPGPAARQAPASEQVSRARGVPSGRAGHYFNRSYAGGGGISRYYNRQDSYFPRSR